jgi:hypothetical protein
VTVVLALLAVVVDLTDGEETHLLALRRENLVEGRGLTPFARLQPDCTGPAPCRPHLASIDAELDRVPDEGEPDLRQIKRVWSTIHVPTSMSSVDDKYRATCVRYTSPPRVAR